MICQVELDLGQWDSCPIYEPVINRNYVFSEKINPMAACDWKEDQ